MAGVQGISQTQSSMRKSSSVGADLWNMAGVGMSRDGNNDWWLAAPGVLKFPDEMAYECDPTLGKPALADCAHIEWNQLSSGSFRPPSDTVLVGPEAVQYFHSSMLYTISLFAMNYRHSNSSA